MQSWVSITPWCLVKKLVADLVRISMNSETLSNDASTMVPVGACYVEAARLNTV